MSQAKGVLQKLQPRWARRLSTPWWCLVFKCNPGAWELENEKGVCKQILQTTCHMDKKRTWIHRFLSPAVCLSSHRFSGTGLLCGECVPGQALGEQQSRTQSTWAVSPSGQREMKAQNQRTREVFPQPLIFWKTVWEPLVNHVVVVIAQPQFHSYESRPVLHAAKGREVLLFVINACEKALITAGAFAGQVRVEWKRPLLASSGTRSHSTPLLWA